MGIADEAEKMAAQYGVPEKNIYSYDNYDIRWRELKISMLSISRCLTACAPNTQFVLRMRESMFLCEKPMATSVRDCQSMINASKARERS